VSACWEWEVLGKGLGYKLGSRIRRGVLAPRFDLDFQELGKGIASKTEAQGLQGDYFVGCNIAQVDIATLHFDEPGLLSFVRGFPKNFGWWDLGKNFFDKTRTNFSGAPKNPNITSFSGFGDDDFGTGFQFGLHHCNPPVGGNDFFSVFGPDLGENTKILGEIADVGAFVFLGHVQRSVRNFDRIEPQFVQESFEFIGALTCRKQFKEGPTQITRIFA